MSPWVATLLMLCVIAGSLGIAYQICLARGIIVRNGSAHAIYDAPKEYLYPTKKEIHEAQHLEWNKEYGLPPYYFVNIETYHWNEEFIDEEEILRRHNLRR